MDLRPFRIAVALALLLSACDGGKDPAAAPAADRTATEPSDAIVYAVRLAGEYRIAGVDDAPIDLPYGITASISADRIHVVADCINAAWSYRFDGPRLVTERVPVEGCARGLTPQEEAVIAAFDTASSVSINRANGRDFTGGGHKVTLFSQ